MTHESHLLESTKILFSAFKVLKSSTAHLVFSWIKVNGLSKKNLGPTSCSVIYKDFDEIFLGCFVMSIKN